MTQDEIIRMAREAGIEANEDNGYLEWWNFAKLIAAHEREAWLSETWDTAIMENENERSIQEVSAGVLVNAPAPETDEDFEIPIAPV